ncbi:MAG: hypothetical protein ABI455_01965, partial [Candidatus Dormiibacterota bacterium]
MSRRAAARRKQRKAPARTLQALWIGVALAAVTAITVLVILALRTTSPSSSATAQGSPHVSVGSLGGGTGQVGAQAPAFS